MSTPKKWDRHSPPTIVVDGSMENLDPLDEIWLTTEKLLRELVDTGRIVCGDDIKIAVKNG